eukprot:3343083-Alexandrium_andersonii.AAC.1
MSASLVGSEMCIRDSSSAMSPYDPPPPAQYVPSDVSVASRFVHGSMRWRSALGTIDTRRRRCDGPTPA